METLICYCRPHCQPDSSQSIFRYSVNKHQHVLAKHLLPSYRLYLMKRALGRNSLIPSLNFCSDLEIIKHKSQMT
uniref:Uncharacterized protein n=1 Tax=Schistosoma japonicum TaxID=6182 RepID=Q5BYY2_SCHJA|nr:unknown [Schistosoma japonicum]